MDFTTIVFLVLAVIIFFRLRSVLGSRTGHERSPFEKKWPVAIKDIKKPEEWEEEPKKPPLSPPVFNAVSDDKLEGIEAGTALASTLKFISNADPKFSAPQFLSGARAAYEQIVTAFAKGDREKLRSLLATEIYETFDEEISEREKKGETVEFHFIAITKAEIVESVLKGEIAQVGVRFTAKLVQATRNAKNEIIEGDATAVTEVSDVWTFERKTSSRDPNWKLVATEDA
jgi:predicted lipid-binding transport protein (Tim44 family)